MALIPLEVIGAAFQVLGSACAKFGLAPHSRPVSFVAAFCVRAVAYAPSIEAAPPLACVAAEYATRALFCGLLLLCNAYGMMLVLKGMASSGSLRATVLNTAANTLCTAIVGAAVFGEVLSLKWGIGASMIGLGVVLISATSSTAPPASLPLTPPPSSSDKRLTRTAARKAAAKSE